MCICVYFPMKRKSLSCVLFRLRMDYKRHGLGHLVYIMVIQLGQYISALKIEVIRRALGAQSRK